MMLFFATLVPQIPYARAATGFRLHAGIFIYNNSGFTAINGVVGGLGTLSQPWVISGWEIISGGIQILGTTAYFIIRDVYLHNGYGITLSVANGQVDNSTVTNAPSGISIVTSTNVIVDRNNVSSNIGDFSSHIVGGISISQSDLVTVSANNVSNNTSNDLTAAPVSGIGIQSSTRVTVKGNHLVSNDIIPSGTPFQLSSLTITSNNTVNGRPVNFYNGCSGTTVNAGPPEELIFADCNNVSVTNTSFSNTGFGIQLLSVNGASLSGDTFSNNVEGIRVYNSTVITINGSNSLTNSTGVDVNLSSIIVIQGSNITSGNTGILVESSKRVTVSQNQLTGSAKGVFAYDSNITIANNLVSGSRQGISISDTGFGINVTANSVLNNGVGILLGVSGCYVQCNPTTANGTISRNIIQNNGDGIDFSVGGVNVRPIINYYITANDLSNNSLGVKVDHGYGVRIYHNNFISNVAQASDPAISAVWDNGYPSGGNYWSDHSSVDNCSGPTQNVCPNPDGIGDNQYLIGQSIDNYPLMKPFGPADTIRPNWPTGSSLSSSSVTQTALTLSWTAATDDTGILSYRIFSGNNLVTTVSGAVLSFQVTGLTAGTQYTFRVEAVDVWGNTSGSDPSTTVKTATGTSQGAAAPPWEQYWLLVALVGAAVVALVGAGLLWSRRRLRDQAPSRRDPIQSTSFDEILR